MTDFEIEYVHNHINYFKTTYGINISQEDFVHDIDVASMVKETAIAGVNYQNVYRKYLKIVANEAYSKYFTSTDINGDEKSYKNTVCNILWFYEMMMVSLLKSSIFEEHNDLPVAEIMFAGMKQDKYTESITPDVLPESCFLEFRNNHKVLDYNKLRDILLIKMHNYKNVANKDFAFRRLAIIYVALVKEYKKNLNISKRLEIKSTLKQFIKYMTSRLDISQKELVSKIKTSVNEVGNYTSSVNAILSVYKTDRVFKTLRNQFEENEELLNQGIAEFKKNIMSNNKVKSAGSPFVDEILSEGGNTNA